MDQGPITRRRSTVIGTPERILRSRNEVSTPKSGNSPPKESTPRRSLRKPSELPTVTPSRRSIRASSAQPEESPSVKPVLRRRRSTSVQPESPLKDDKLVSKRRKSSMLPVSDNNPNNISSRLRKSITSKSPPVSDSVKDIKRVTRRSMNSPAKDLIPTSNSPTSSRKIVLKEVKSSPSNSSESEGKRTPPNTRSLAKEVNLSPVEEAKCETKISPKNILPKEKKESNISLCTESSNKIDIQPLNEHKTLETVSPSKSVSLKINEDKNDSCTESEDSGIKEMEEFTVGNKVMESSSEGNVAQNNDPVPSFSSSIEVEKENILPQTEIKNCFINVDSPGKITALIEKKTPLILLERFDLKIVDVDESSYSPIKISVNNSLTSNDKQTSVQDQFSPSKKLNEEPNEYENNKSLKKSFQNLGEQNEILDSVDISTAPAVTFTAATPVSDTNLCKSILESSLSDSPPQKKFESKKRSLLIRFSESNDVGNTDFTTSPTSSDLISGATKLREENNLNNQVLFINEDDSKDNNDSKTCLSTEGNMNSFEVDSDCDIYLQIKDSDDEKSFELTDQNKIDLNSSKLPINKSNEKVSIKTSPKCASLKATFDHPQVAAMQLNKGDIHNKSADKSLDTDEIDISILSERTQDNSLKNVDSILLDSDEYDSPLKKNVASTKSPNQSSKKICDNNESDPEIDSNNLLGISNLSSVTEEIHLSTIYEEPENTIENQDTKYSSPILSGTDKKLDGMLKIEAVESGVSKNMVKEVEVSKDEETGSNVILADESKMLEKEALSDVGLITSKMEAKQLLSEEIPASGVRKINDEVLENNRSTSDEDIVIDKKQFLEQKSSDVPNLNNVEEIRDKILDDDSKFKNIEPHMPILDKKLNVIDAENKETIKESESLTTTKDVSEEEHIKIDDDYENHKESSVVIKKEDSKPTKGNDSFVNVQEIKHLETESSGINNSLTEMRNGEERTSEIGDNEESKCAVTSPMENTVILNPSTSQSYCVRSIKLICEDSVISCKNDVVEKSDHSTSDMIGSSKELNKSIEKSENESLSTSKNDTSDKVSSTKTSNCSFTSKSSQIFSEGNNEKSFNSEEDSQDKVNTSDKGCPIFGSGEVPAESRTPCVSSEEYKCKTSEFDTKILNDPVDTDKSLDTSCPDSSKSVNDFTLVCSSDKHSTLLNYDIDKGVDLNDSVETEKAPSETSFRESINKTVISVDLSEAETSCDDVTYGKLRSTVRVVTPPGSVSCGSVLVEDAIELDDSPLKSVDLAEKQDSEVDSSLSELSDSKSNLKFKDLSQKNDEDDEGSDDPDFIPEDEIIELCSSEEDEEGSVGDDECSDDDDECSVVDEEYSVEEESSQESSENENFSVKDLIDDEAEEGNETSESDEDSYSDVPIMHAQQETTFCKDNDNINLSQIHKSKNQLSNWKVVENSSQESIIEGLSNKAEENNRFFEIEEISSDCDIVTEPANPLKTSRIAKKRPQMVPMKQPKKTDVKKVSTESKFAVTCMPIEKCEEQRIRSYTGCGVKFKIRKLSNEHLNYILTQRESISTSPFIVETEKEYRKRTKHEKNKMYNNNSTWKISNNEHFIVNNKIYSCNCNFKVTSRRSESIERHEKKISMIKAMYKLSQNEKVLPLSLKCNPSNLNNVNIHELNIKNIDKLAEDSTDLEFKKDKSNLKHKLDKIELKENLEFKKSCSSVEKLHEKSNSDQQGKQEDRETGMKISNNNISKINKKYIFIHNLRYGMNSLHIRDLLRSNGINNFIKIDLTKCSPRSFLEGSGFARIDFKSVTDAQNCISQCNQGLYLNGVKLIFANDQKI